MPFRRSKHGLHIMTASPVCQSMWVNPVPHVLPFAVSRSFSVSTATRLDGLRRGLWCHQHFD